MAETIAESMGADLFELVPKEPYSDADLDWTDDNSRVSKEHDDEDGRHVELEETKVENFDSIKMSLSVIPYGGAMRHGLWMTL